MKLINLYSITTLIFIWPYLYLHKTFQIRDLRIGQVIIRMVGLRIILDYNQLPQILLMPHSGSLCAELKVLDVFRDPFPPELLAGSDGLGFSVSEKHDTLYGYYSTPQSGYIFEISIFMWEGGSQGIQIGTGNFSSSNIATDWTRFSVPITYEGIGTPDLCLIRIWMNTDQSIGSVVFIDDLGFDVNDSAEITVTSPNGGETWLVGSNHNISWTSENVDSIKIEYSTNSGIDWNIIVNSVAADIGAYDWIAPNIPSYDCLIKLTSTLNPAVFDVSDENFQILSYSSLNTTFLGGINFVTTSEGVFVKDEYAYVTVNAAGLIIVDITDEDNLFIVGSYNTPGIAEGIHVLGNYAYVADNSEGLRIINIENPTSPFEVGYFNLSSANAYSVHVEGTFAYIAYGTSGLRIVNIENPGNPYEVGSFIPGEVLGLEKRGDFVYLVNSNAFRIVDVTNPTTPFEVGSYELLPNTALDLAIENNLAFIADGWGGLRVIDFNAPQSPIEISFSTTPSGGLRQWIVNSTEQIQWSCSLI